MFEKTKRRIRRDWFGLQFIELEMSVLLSGTAHRYCKNCTVLKM